jgi:hypothetical protein
MASVLAEIVVNNRVRVVSHRGDSKVREGVIVKVATRKSDGKAYFVMDCNDEQRYHTLYTQDAVVHRLD